MSGGRLVLAALIVAATGLFVIGVAVERSQPERDAAQHVESSAAESETHGESTTSEGSEAHATTRESGSDQQREARLLGVNPESTPLVILAMIGSLILAAAVLRWPQATLLLAFTALAMIAFAALDVREVAHQLDEDRTGVAVLAGSVAALHLAASAVAAGEAMSSGPRRHRLAPSG
jgi:hypothetical protein